MMKPVPQRHITARLRRDRLEEVPSDIRTPLYRFEDLSPGIVHIGVGNFHRAHQAWYIHELMQLGQARDWALIGAGVRDYDVQMRENLRAQDYLTTLIELDPSGVSAEIIGPMIDYLPIQADNGPLIQQMAEPAIRIVSLTVTEGGYYLDANTGVFDETHVDIQYDARNPDQPRTVFGALVAALNRRKLAGLAPFTALSCDNLQGNGTILRNCVVRLARLSNPDLADWIEQHGAFPNSMVDCIVPATTNEVLDQCHALGIDDLAPVTHENFRQWVIEDNFCAGRPPLENVGVTITKNVHSYEKMKLRILNGGHQLLANVGEILNMPTISDCMDDPQIASFFEKVQTEDILGHVDSVPGMTPSEYLKLVGVRFANRSIRDTTRRVAFDGSSRHPGFLLPTLREALAAKASIRGLALAEAFWCRMCAGTREDGSAIVANDPLWNVLHGRATAARHNPRIWIEAEQFYGNLAKDEQFKAAFTRWLRQIREEGSRAAMQSYLSEAV